MQAQTHKNGIHAVVGAVCQTHEPAFSNDSLYDAFEVRWLPSMPLLNKRHAPPAAGVGILYSEEFDQIFHVFETDNLHRSINSCSRQQTTALALDPNCRLSWYETADAQERNQLLTLLSSRSVSAKAG